MPIEEVGVIGLCADGCTSARRLLENGFGVSAHDRNGWAVAELVEVGARPARIPADATEAADLVFVHVPDEAGAEEVLFDLGGVGETLRDGGCIVLAATTGAAFVLAAADRLEALGLTMVEAWFTRDAGGPVPTVLVGGSPEDLERVAPALAAVASTVLHVGPLGSVSALRTAIRALCPLPVGGDLDPGRTSAVTALTRTVVAALVDAGGAPRVPSPAVEVPAPRDGTLRPVLLPGTSPGVLTLEKS